MIRFVVGAVLLFYFLGADVFAPYQPPVLSHAFGVFHSEINRGTWRIVGPSVNYIRGMMASDEDRKASPAKEQTGAS